MSAPTTTLAELGWLFLRLGATAFGGPAAHVALFRTELVSRRRWLTDERFLELLAASALLPGPTSTELAIHLGWERRGWRGLLVAGAAFILPAAALSAVLASVYVATAELPAVGWVLYGVKPVMVAIVVHALVGLAPAAVPTWERRALAAAAVGLALTGMHELAVLLVIGLGAVVLSRKRSEGVGPTLTLAPSAQPEWGAGADAAAGPAAVAASAVAVAGATVPTIFLVFLRIGSALFGSGYVLLAFLRSELVERLGWLGEGELLDAVAVGQITPGPVFSTATFIGYLLGGPAGAAAATAGIFLPAFAFVAVSGVLLPRIRASASARAFLDGVGVASLALLAAVALELGRAAVVDVATALLAAGAAALLLTTRTNPSLVLLGAGLLGALVQAAGLAGG